MWTQGLLGLLQARTEGRQSNPLEPICPFGMPNACVEPKQLPLASRKAARALAMVTSGEAARGRESTAAGC